ncbi:MAG: CotH kinase family protein [Corallococcus sp.]|nr:CotH kinase family protein [Bacillota bacterium]MCM1533192.1 CotH kinase family protein [Corallococcus sp.]
MKKTAIIILLAIMLVSLAACGLIEANPPVNENVVITFLSGEGVFSDGGTTLTAHPYEENGKVQVSEEPHRDGYAFSGWFYGDEKFDSSKSYAQNKTFTARYVSGSENKVYEALFSENSTVAIDIDMSDAEWKKLNQDYIDFLSKGGKSPIYRMANSVIIGIDDGNGWLNYYYEEVGVRMKGNTSRHAFYSNGGFTNNIHMKLSFKQTFDDVSDGYTQDELKVWSNASERAARKNRTLGGMEKIDIKYNSTADETYVRELYAMKLFRDNGIYAPNVTLCSLTALEKNKTKKNLGVYRIYEPIDEVFVTRNIGEAKVGDLWKCTYTTTGPADLTTNELDKRVGVEDELKGEFYSYDKKTNKKKNATTGLRDLSSVKNFITALNKSNADYSKLIDVEYFAKFEAVNYILGNPDCIRNNYNNYYLYFRADGRAIIIPYDYDRCLGITKDWNPTGSANMNVTPYTRTVAATGGGQTNPLYINLIDKGAPTGSGSALSLYRQNLLTLNSSQALTALTFDNYKNNFKSKYAQYTSSAIKTNNLAFDATNTGNVAYATYMQTKLKTLTDNINNYNP